MRRLSDALEVWVASFHFTPGCTVDVFSTQLDIFLSKMPKGKHRVIVQGDANASFGWIENEGLVDAIGRDAKALILLDRFHKQGLTLVAPRPPFRRLPTSRPRQEGRAGKQIDIVAVSRLRHEGSITHQDSCLTLGTDHELLQGCFRVVTGKIQHRCETKPRVWVGGPDKIDYLDQGVLEDLAARCTKPRQSQAYRDPKAVKQLMQQAKLSRTREAWKNALAARRSARRSWELARQDRALKGDWGAFRQSKAPSKQGWELEYADMQTRDPHETVHDHLSRIYKGVDIEPKYLPDQPAVAFTVEDLKAALTQLKGQKSVGRDLTSKELLQAVVNIEGGEGHLLEYLNRILATQRIPRAWNEPLLIVLPKTEQPSGPADLRPIALGSSTAKLFSRMLLNRVSHLLPYTSHAQCAGGQRQASDVLFTIWRLMQLEREWKGGLAMCQIDISKAFDSLDRGKLVDKLERVKLPLQYWVKTPTDSDRRSLRIHMNMGAFGAAFRLWGLWLLYQMWLRCVLCTASAPGFFVSMSSSMGLLTHAQPPEILGDWPPHWYLQGQAMAAPLLESGSEPNDLMGFLHALIVSREDDHYASFVYELTADVEQSIGGRLNPDNEIGPLAPEEMRWCRYIEEHFHLEYLEAFYPHQQAALENQAGSLPHEFFNLEPPAEGEPEPDAVRRVEFNNKRRYSKLMRIVLQLPIPGDSSASSGEEVSMWDQASPLLENQRSSRMAPAPVPMRTLHEIKVRWLQQVMDHLRQAHYEGDDGWSYEMLRRRILGRNEGHYRIRGMAYLNSAASAQIVADTLGAEPPDYVQDWAVQVEASLHRILSLLEPCDDSLGMGQASSSWLHAEARDAPDCSAGTVACLNSSIDNEGIQPVTDSDVIEVISVHDDSHTEDDEVCSLVARAKDHSHYGGPEVDFGL
ncbi:unnamed protein product [Symbiodinium sp. CCMP2592]|nr:unnamed protein product [Symbiodinium sp. CCMP2592]